jgi:hypothetical protein
MPFAQPSAVAVNRSSESALKVSVMVVGAALGGVTRVVSPRHAAAQRVTSGSANELAPDLIRYA